MIDLVVSKIIKGSRKDATFLIETELVQLNHTSVTKTSKTVQENDIISIRKKGRFKILNTQKTSKKGKIILIYGKFI